MTPDRSLKILMTTDAVGGVWTYAALLSTALADTGHMVHLVTMGPGPRDDQRAMVNHPRICLIESSLALEWEDPAGMDVAHARHALHSIDRAIQPDIIHLNSFREALFEWSAPVIVVAHSCVKSWSIACRDQAWLSEPQWQHYIKTIARALERADTWVSPSWSFRKVIDDLYRPTTPGLVIWNGIPIPSTRTTEKDAVVLAAGRVWDQAKNLSLLAEAARGLAYPVYLAGPGTLDSSDQALKPLGYLSYAALQDQMKRAAVFASPARYEPFGLSVLEAASAGCALILSDLPTFRELWDGAAIFANPSDAQGWHRVISDICSDDRKRHELQRRASDRASRYSLARTADAYQALYHRLLASTSRSTTMGDVLGVPA